MIATVDIADLGIRRTIGLLRRRPAPGEVSGLRWLEIALAAPLATRRPPRLRRAVMIALWDDADSAAAFASTHPVAAEFGAGFHATLRPLRAFGAWPGLDDQIRRSRVSDDEGPVLVVTLGRLRVTQLVRFLRTSRPAERAAVQAPGFRWGTAAARPPFVATVSIWDSGDSAAAYAYTTPSAGHPRAIEAQRRKDFHRQSAFIRFAPIEMRGALGNANPLPPAAVIPERD